MTSALIYVNWREQSYWYDAAEPAWQLGKRKIEFCRIGAGVRQQRKCPEVESVSNENGSDAWSEVWWKDASEELVNEEGCMWRVVRRVCFGDWGLTVPERQKLQRNAENINLKNRGKFHQPVSSAPIATNINLTQRYSKPRVRYHTKNLVKARKDIYYRSPFKVKNMYEILRRLRIRSELNSSIVPEYIW